MRRNHLGLALLFSTLALAACGGEEAPAVHVHDSLEAARAEAAARGVPVLVDFYADWCEPCRQFDTDRADGDEISDALGEVVFAKLDVESEAHEPTAEAYRIHGYPTFLLMNAAGEEIDRWSGYDEPAGFVASLTGARADLSTVEQKLARLEAEPTLELALRLANIHERREDPEAAVAALELARRLDPDASIEHDLRILEMMAVGLGEIFDKGELRKQADLVFSDGEVPASDLLAAAWTMHRAATDAGDDTLRSPYVEQALDRAGSVEADEHDAYTHTKLQIVRALHIDDDPGRAVELKRASFDEGWRDDAESLNAFAWWCFENGINLEEAYDLALRGVERAESDETKAMILDTVAEICNARGDCEGAIEWIDLAIAADPDNEYYVKQKSRFEELLASRLVF